MALARCSSYGLTDLPWRAPRWQGHAATLLYQHTMMHGDQFSLYRDEATKAHIAFHSRHPSAAQQAAAWTASFGWAYPQEAESGNVWWSTLFDLDWNLLIRVIFTRFAYGAHTHCLGVTWNAQLVHAILERHDLETLHSFCASFEYWVVSSPAAAHTVLGGHFDQPLRDLSRPGAWLLDSFYTEVLVVLGERPPNIQYEVVGNRALQAMAGHIFVEQTCANALRHRCRNYVGNVMEHLAWLAFEDGREELIVALAYFLFFFE